MTEINIGNMTGSNLVTGVVAGDVSATGNSISNNSANQQVIEDAIQEIKILIDRLEKDSVSSNTTVGKMKVAAEFIEEIDRNPSIAGKILNAIKVGGIKAIEQALNHPAPSFVIGALEAWHKDK
jgi:shikimate kinase